MSRTRSQARGTAVRKQILTMLSLRETRGHAPPPTIREIAKVVHRSPATVQRHIEVLTELGMLERRTPGLARTIKLRNMDAS